MAWVQGHEVKVRLGQIIDEHAGFLADRCEDTLDQMRFNQGVIAGLRIAVLVIDEVNKGMVD